MKVTISIDSGSVRSHMPIIISISPRANGHPHPGIMRVLAIANARFTIPAAIALVYVISQCICDYLLTPKIMGKTLGLNPAIILLSLSIWGTLLGIIGMIIALPLTAILIAYYKQYILSSPKKEPSSPIRHKSV